MENLEINKLFGGIYKNKKVVVTGHTGFKGSWLAMWLKKMGADVYGIALDPPSHPNHIDLLQLEIKSYIQNICDFNKVKEILSEINPDIIFHLAAQPLVRLSYQDPVNTYMTNVMGTVNVLETARSLSNLKAVVIVTSDKCYENKEWLWGYRENEAMGGADPYSSSKGCVELVTTAYRNSFFNPSNTDEENKVLIASARAGNVIGGGDWATDRILTDIVKAASISASVYLRYPKATRPWQYVLEPLSGYLNLGWKLLLGEKAYAEGWNFGPNTENNISVLNLVMEAKKSWEKISFDFDNTQHPHEAGFLMLDSSKAIKILEWKPVWGLTKTIEKTIFWYKEFYENNNVISCQTLEEYILDAQKKEIPWSKT
jgi:CDP-glucose 4,6-dehydratase